MQGYILKEKVQAGSIGTSIFRIGNEGGSKLSSIGKSEMPDAGACAAVVQNTKAQVVRDRCTRR